MKKGRSGRKQHAGVDAAQVWEDIEKYFVPHLGLGLVERLIYYHLIRKTRVAGRRVLTTAIGDIASAVRLNSTGVRIGVRRLAGRGALRILERGRDGHKLEVRTPREIGWCIRAARKAQQKELPPADFFRSKPFQRAIFERERHRCFYCLRQLKSSGRVLDHVVPQMSGGRDSYRNIVACCAPCNSEKKQSAAEDFLRQLHRKDLLNRKELSRRLAALRALKQGRLRPHTEVKTTPRRFKPQEGDVS